MGAAAAKEDTETRKIVSARGTTVGFEVKTMLEQDKDSANKSASEEEYHQANTRGLTEG